ncbi:MAG: GAF domain-containing protein [Anaerolineae bacterium]|nr:GAF domain-containing protein [Anaerolineae bacterium]
MPASKGVKKTNSETSSHALEINKNFAGVLDSTLLADEAALLKRLACAIEKFLGKGEASIFLVTDRSNQKVITYKAGSSDITQQRLNGFQLQMGEGVVGYTIQTGQPQLITDINIQEESNGGPVFCRKADERSDYSTKSLACAPITLHDQVLGAIEIVDKQPNRFSEADLSLLSSIADFSANIVHDSRYIQALKHQSKQLNASAKVITQAVAHLDAFEALPEKIADSIHLNFDIDVVKICLFDENEDQDSKPPTEPNSALTLPLAICGETIGVVILQNASSTSDGEEIFSDETTNILKLLVNQLAFVIHHAKSYQQINLKKQNLEIIQALDKQVISTTDKNLSENLHLILSKSLELIGIESGQIFRYDEKAKTLVVEVASAESYPKAPQPLEGIFEHVISSRQSACIGDLKNWEPTANMNSRLSIPLVTGDLVVGIFNVESAHLNAFTSMHQNMLEYLAPQATIAIQNAYLFRQKIHRASLLQAASEVSSKAISIRDLNVLLQSTVETIVDKFGYYHAAVFVVDDEDKAWMLLQADASERGQKVLPRDYRIRVGSDTPVGQATGPFRKYRLALYTAQENSYTKNPHLSEARSEIALPLSVKTAKRYKTLGALNIHSTEENAFATKDIAMLQAMADQLAVIISNDRLYDQAKKEKELIEVLREIDRRIINPGESKTDLLRFILTESCRLTGAENGQIFLVEGDSLRAEIATKSKDLNTKVPMVVGSIIGDAVFNEHILVTDLNKLLSGENGIARGIDYTRAYKPTRLSRIAVRIHEEDGNVVGVLSVDDYKPNKFTVEHREILSALAGQAAIGIKNRILMSQAEVRHRHLEATAQVGADIISSLNVAELLDKTVDLIHQKFKLYYAGIFLIEQIEEKGRKQKIAKLKAISDGNRHQYANREHQFEVGGRSMVGITISTGQAQITHITLGGNGASNVDKSILPETLSKMTLPLRNRKGVIGVLEVQSVETIFTADDTQMLQTMADQLAIAIYNADLYQRTEQDKQQLAALREIDLAIISTELDLDQTLELILNKGLALIETKAGSLSLLESDQEHLIIRASSQKNEIGSGLPVDKSILGLAVEKQHTIRIADVSLEPRYQMGYDLFSDTAIRSVLLIPLKEDTSIIGVFGAYRSQINAFSDKHQETLETLARQAAIAIKNASLYSQAQRRAALLKAAAKVSQSVISIFDLDQLLNKIVNTICDEFEEREFHYAAVFLLDETGKYAWQQAGTGEVGHNLVAEGFKFKVDVDDSIVSIVVQSGQGAIEEYNVYLDDENHHTIPLLPNTLSEMALPLKLRYKVIGVLTVHSRQKNAFSDEDTQTLQSMADQLAIAIDNVKKQEKLVEAETLKTIDEATSQAMHWVANKARPIKDYIERLDREISPLITKSNVDETLQEDFFEAIEVIKQNASLILDVKQEIMGTARQFDLVKASLEAIVAKVLKQIDSPGVHIRQDIASDLPPVQVDCAAVEEVFRNLFVNAIHAMKPLHMMKETESPELHIKAQTTKTGDFVEVRIIDNGTGIAVDKIKHIWTPFYTTKAGTGGTGVGLSYCLQAMHKMGGKITVESDIGQGTTFILILPVSPEVEPY